MTTEDSKVHIATALNLSWAFGINKHVPVLNLSTKHKKALFYITGHTGVLFDFENNTQILYQGHCNNISASCVSTDKRWLATSDIGKNSMIIVWDTNQSIPIKTLFDVDPVGTKKLCFSNDAKYIVSLGADLPQVVNVWNWTLGDDEPLISLKLQPTLHLQNYITFSTNNVEDVVSNSPDQVIFYKWNLEGEMSHVAPRLEDKDFNKTIGNYSQTIFQPNSSLALTATDYGNIVVWACASSTTSEMKALKIIHMQEKPITVLTSILDYLVTADVSGYVKFFDSQMKLINWYKQLGCQGAVNGVSFTFTKTKPALHQPATLEEGAEMGGDYPDQSTLEEREFIVDDFSVSTDRAQYLYFQTDGSQTLFLQQEHEKDIRAIACHPKSSYLAIGSFSGILQIIDYETKELQQQLRYSQNYSRITSLAYSQGGDFLAIGFDTGNVEILDSVTLQIEGSLSGVAENEARFDYSNDAIKHMCFSHDNTYLACADIDNCVVVFVYNEKDPLIPWRYLGKHRAHYKPISDLMFLESLDEGEPRLLSLGHDRMLVEYDLANSSLDELRLLSSDRIEQDGVPISLSLYPPVVKESFLLVSNDKYKLKLFNTTTKMCRHTFLGPTYGTPIQKISVLPTTDDKTCKRFMAYCTQDKIGLSMFPLDGNPFKSMALIAHPNKVHDLVCSFDGKYVFTAGGEDTTVLMWKTDTNALEASARLGGEGLTPFYTLLEGGREGELFSELEEYFYYAQMKHQGIDTMETREVSGTIPLSEIPFVVRALGFYPTEQQIEEMTNEVKFSSYVETGHYVNQVDLEALIKLYINHRPAFGLHPDQLVNAFEKIGLIGEEGDVEIQRSELLAILQDKGEHLSEGELAEYLSSLFGGGADTENFSLEDCLPEKISISMFAKQLLGLELASE
eukprot:TCONS_00067430-protein